MGESVGNKYHGCRSPGRCAWILFRSRLFPQRLARVKFRGTDLGVGPTWIQFRCALSQPLRPCRSEAFRSSLPTSPSSEPFQARQVRGATVQGRKPRGSILDPLPSPLRRSCPCRLDPLRSCPGKTSEAEQNHLECPCSPRPVAILSKKTSESSDKDAETNACKHRATLENLPRPQPNRTKPEVGTVSEKPASSNTRIASETLD